MRSTTLRPAAGAGLGGSRLGLARPRAERQDRAGRAGRLAGGADPPAVENEEVAGLRPAWARQDLAELVVDLLGTVAPGQPQALRHPEPVSIHRPAREAD